MSLISWLQSPSTAYKNIIKLCMIGIDCPSRCYWHFQTKERHTGRRLQKRWQEYTGELYKKDLHDPDNHNGVITHLEPDILECEVKWALESITMNKASGGDGIPVELFQILKDDAVEVLHCICLLLLLSHFSRVRLCATSEMAAHQVLLSLGFSRQEKWSGVPLPSLAAAKSLQMMTAALKLKDTCSLEAKLWQT